MVAEVEKGVDVDAVRVAQDAIRDQTVARPPSTSMMRPLSLRCRRRENLHLASCGMPGVKMIRLRHDRTTCIFPLLPFVSRLLF